MFDAKENDGFLKNENEAKQSLDMNIFQSNLKPEGKSPMTEKVLNTLVCSSSRRRKIVMANEIIEFSVLNFCFM